MSDDLDAVFAWQDRALMAYSERDRLRAELATARELLEDAYYQLDPIYLADGVTLHPGCVSTLHALYAYLWPEGRKP